MPDGLAERRALLHDFTNKLTPLAAHLDLAMRNPAQREARIRAALTELDKLVDWAKARSRELALEARARGADVTAAPVALGGTGESH